MGDSAMFGDDSATDTSSSSSKGSAAPLVLGAFGGATALYLVRSFLAARAAARPLQLAPEEQPLYLVNFTSSEAGCLSAVLGSWAGPLRPTVSSATDFGNEALLGQPATQARVDALSGFRESCSAANENDGGRGGMCVGQAIGVRIAPPGATSAKGNHELTAGTVDRSRLETYAARFEGCVIEVTVYLALARSATETREFRRTVSGRVCSPNDLPAHASSVEDLFVLDTSDPSRLMPRMAVLEPLTALTHDAPLGVDLAAGARAAARQSAGQDLGDGVDGGLLVRPHRWRAYLDLAFELMYGDQDKYLRARASGTGLSSWFAPVTTAIARDAALVGRSVSRFVSKFQGGNNRTGRAVDKAAIEEQRAALAHDATSPLCGRFENHITIEFDSASNGGGDESKRFVAVAEALGIKVVSIVLPRGALFPAQVMTSYYTTGHVRQCTEALLEQGLLLTLCGFKCARVKMELQLTEDLRAPFFQRDAASAAAETFPPYLGLCPLSSELAKDRRAMTSLQYYEFHVKVTIPEVRVTEATPALQEVAKAHSAHLSKNAFKEYTGGGGAATSNNPSSSPPAEMRMCQYFLTLRKYAMGFTDCMERVHALSATATEALTAFDGAVTSMQREFSVFDSNTGLDAGWFDRSHATPSFMQAAGAASDE